jgi:HSP20 family protein
MEDMTRWEPVRDIERLWDAMDRLFWEGRERAVGDMPLLRTGAVRTLPVDMYETDTGLVVKASVPGVKPENVDITVAGNVLTIRGEFKEEEGIERGSYYHRERGGGEFQRSLVLPDEIKAGEAEASFENGVLTLRMPKAEEARPKQIKVQVK